MCGALGVAWLDARLLAEGDLRPTVENIRAHALSFRVGIVSVLVIYASVLVASWALFILLAPVSRAVSLLALLFRSAEATVGFATILMSLVVAQLVTPDGPATALGEAAIAAWVGVAVAWRAAALDIVLSVWLGVLWGFWHFPMFWQPESFTAPLSFLLLVAKLFAWLPPYRVLMVWVHERTHSFILVALMHVSLVMSLACIEPPLTGSNLLTFIAVRATLLWLLVAFVGRARSHQHAQHLP